MGYGQWANISFNRDFDYTLRLIESTGYWLYFIEYKSYICALDRAATSHNLNNTGNILATFWYKVNNKIIK